jgi:hypothetical protein
LLSSFTQLNLILKIELPASHALHIPSEAQRVSHEILDKIFNPSTKTTLPPLTNPPGYFVTINPEKFVQQITLAMHFLFQQIPLQEFLFPKKYGDPVKCPKLYQLKAFKTRVCRPHLSLSSLLLSSDHSPAVDLISYE